MTKKKMITILLAVMVLLSVVITMPSAEAAGNYTIRLAGADGSNVVSAKPGDTVKLILSAQNNPGILSVGVQVSYPSGLSMTAQPKDVSGLSGVATVYKTFSPQLTSNPYLLWWNMPLGGTGKKLVTKEGNLAEITFKVASDIQPGDYSITLAAPRDKNLTAGTSGGVIAEGTNKDVSGISLEGCTVRVGNTCAQGHSYGAWKDAGSGKHSRTCSVCSAIDTADHTWNSGTVTKQPTCKDEGIKTYLCTDCKATKTELVAKPDDHTYDNACDPDCSVCGYVRQTAHAFGTEWTSDAAGHWYACTRCGEKADMEEHTAAADADESAAQICYICGFEMSSLNDTQPDSTEASTEPSTDGTNTNTNTNKILLWVVFIVFVTVAVSIAVLLIGKKRY
jgi:uncharacterized protein YlaI